MPKAGLLPFPTLSFSASAPLALPAPPRSAFTLDGKIYKTVEHFYQSQKFAGSSESGAAQPALLIDSVSSDTHHSAAAFSRLQSVC